MKSYPSRWLISMGQVAWVFCVLYVAACLAAPSLVGSTGCELIPGSSFYGEASRSWLPPGTTCTYSLTEFGSRELVIPPSPVRLVVVALVLVGPPVLLYLRSLLRLVPAESVAVPTT